MIKILFTFILVVIPSGRADLDEIMDAAGTAGEIADYFEGLQRDTKNLPKVLEDLIDEAKNAYAKLREKKVNEKFFPNLKKNKAAKLETLCGSGGTLRESGGKYCENDLYIKSAIKYCLRSSKGDEADTFGYKAGSDGGFKESKCYKKMKNTMTFHILAPGYKGILTDAEKGKLINIDEYKTILRG